jgi:uncharacterized protein
MEFDWDAGKAAANLAKHGLAFASIREWVWEEVRSSLVDGDYSEPRWRALYTDEAGQRLIAIYTRRGGAYRVISLRRAHEKEVRKWES